MPVHRRVTDRHQEARAKTPERISGRERHRRIPSDPPTPPGDHLSGDVLRHRPDPTRLRHPHKLPPQVLSEQGELPDLVRFPKQQCLKLAAERLILCSALGLYL